MADNLTREQRSFNMSRIRSKNTSPEMTVRKFLHIHGFRFRLHSVGLPGKPDIILPKLKTIVLIHGCFWHGHKCMSQKIPKTRTEYWIQKIAGNQNRDKRNLKELKRLGWKVYTLWECSIKSGSGLSMLSRTLKSINNKKLGSVKKVPKNV